MSVLLNMKAYMESLSFLCVLLVLTSTVGILHNGFCKDVNTESVQQRMKTGHGIAQRRYFWMEKRRKGTEAV